MPTLSHPRVIPPREPIATKACANCRLRADAICAGACEPVGSLWQAQRVDTRVRAGDRLYVAGSLHDAIYIVRSGVLKLERVTDAGERRVVRLAGMGQTLGLEALSGESARGSLVALTDASLCRLPVAAVNACQHAHPGLAQRISRALLAELDDAYHWMTEFQVGTLRRRLLRLLLECQQLFNGSRIVLPSREDLGAMLGVTLETASRAVSELRRSGALVAQGRGEFLVDTALVRAQLGPDVPLSVARRAQD